MPTPSHTPVPWTRDHDYIVDAEDCYVASVYDAYVSGKNVSRANADFIVRACNAHDAMLAALREADAWIAEASEYLSDADDDKSARLMEVMGAVVNKMTAAIAKAEGRS